MTEAPRERSTSSKTRLRILACGRRIVARSGVRAVTVRGVAAQAKVNLGTFVYHFGTREEFVNELMESLYAPIYARLLEASVDESSPPLERLRRYMAQLGAFLAENRVFVRNLCIDAAGDEPTATRFMKSLLGRHPMLLFRLVAEAQRTGVLRAGDPVSMGMLLFGATLFPTLWFGVLLPEHLLGDDASPVSPKALFAPEQIEQRFEWAVQGLARPATKVKNDKGKKMTLQNRKPAATVTK